MATTRPGTRSPRASQRGHSAAPTASLFLSDGARSTTSWKLGRCSPLRLCASIRSSPTHARPKRSRRRSALRRSISRGASRKWSGSEDPRLRAPRCATIYTYVCICIHTHMYICVCIYICIATYTYIYIFICWNLYAPVSWPVACHSHHRSTIQNACPKLKSSRTSNHGKTRRRYWRRPTRRRMQ